MGWKLGRRGRAHWEHPAVNAIRIVAAATAADHLLPRASQAAASRRAAAFALGALISAAQAFGSAALMRRRTLAALGANYSGAVRATGAAIGLIAFDELFGARETLRQTLAHASAAVFAADDA